MFSIYICDFDQENKSCFAYLSFYTDDSKILMLRFPMGDSVNKVLFTAYGLKTLLHVVKPYVLAWKLY